MDGVTAVSQFGEFKHNLRTYFPSSFYFFFSQKHFTYISECYGSSCSTLHEYPTLCSFKRITQGLSHQGPIAAEVLFILPRVLLGGGVSFTLLGSIPAEVIGRDVTYDPAELRPPPVRRRFGVDEQPVAAGNAQLRDTHEHARQALDSTSAKA